MINSGALHTMKAYKDPGNKTVRFVNLDVSLGCRLRYGPATLVTPYNRVLENLIVPQPVKKFLALYAVGSFITVS